MMPRVLTVPAEMVAVSLLLAYICATPIATMARPLAAFVLAYIVTYPILMSRHATTHAIVGIPAVAGLAVAICTYVYALCVAAGWAS